MLLRYQDMIALKEWAVVCKALEEGRQTILLRKGGIMEYREGFELKHDKFLLFPTFEHQSKDSIKQDYYEKFDELILENNTAKEYVDLSLFGNVIDVKEIKDKDILKKLYTYHIWNERYVDFRMNYNPTKPMSVLFLRIYKIKEPVKVNIKKEWAGCKSWINMDGDISSTMINKSFKQLDENLLKPVIDDLTFNRLVNEINGVIK